MVLDNVFTILLIFYLSLNLCLSISFLSWLESEHREILKAYFDSIVLCQLYENVKLDRRFIKSFINSENIENICEIPKKVKSS